MNQIEKLIEFDSFPPPNQEIKYSTTHLQQAKKMINNKQSKER